MSALATADPRDHGLDPQRLTRIDAHLKRYVDDGYLPGWHVLISRHGQTVYSSTYGPYADDTIVRLFSMTKPMTSVAAMMLYEQGAFELKTPIQRYIPSFKEARVYRTGSTQRPLTDPLVEPIRVWHLLTHTSGLTYGFHHAHVTDALYRQAGFEWGSPKGMDLAAVCDAWAALPLAFQPGREWLYGVSTDVLGRVVEVASGMPLDEFFRTRILEPLGMHDTSFRVPDEQHGRCAELWFANPLGGPGGPAPSGFAAPGDLRYLSGGGGLWGTGADYIRFCNMLLGKGSVANPDGPPVRLLGPRTVDFMTRNHLPGNAELETFGRPLFAETQYDGVGFGLGFAVMMDPPANKTLASAGEFSWGGAASTSFWCDPAEDLAVVFLTQLMPSSTYPIRSELRQLVNQAIVA